jgi:predicted adenylyl cyclase CyaB
MSLEIEKSFNLNDPLLNNNPEYPSKAQIIKKLKKFGAKKRGIYLFRIMKFIPPYKKYKLDTIRVRDEGFRTTLTYKHKDKKSKYKKEYEVIIDDFDQGVEILKQVGLKEDYYYEKLREIWNYKKCEIVFDDKPALPPIMEIESHHVSKNIGEKELYNLAKKLGLYGKTERGYGLYDRLYGIKFKKTDLTFNKAKTILKSKCKKNKSIMLKLLNKQLKIYNQIIKK